MGFRDRLTGALGGGLFTGGLGDESGTRGIDILKDKFQGLGSGGIFGRRQRQAQNEADLAQAADPTLQTETIDDIDSTGMGTVGMSEIAMEDPMLAASVNGRNFSPYSKRGKVKVKQRSYGEEGVELPIVKSKEGLFKKPEFYLTGGDYHDPESDTEFIGEQTREIKGPSKRAIKGKGRRSGEAYVDIVGGDFDFAAMENIKPI